MIFRCTSHFLWIQDWILHVCPNRGEDEEDKLKILMDNVELLLILDYDWIYIWIGFQDSMNMPTLDEDSAPPHLKKKFADCGSSINWH